MPNYQEQANGDQLANLQQFSRERAQEKQDKQDVNPFSVAVSGLVGAALAKKLFGNRGS